MATYWAVLAMPCSDLRASLPSGQPPPSPTPIRMVVCDLSAAPYLDLGGSRMLHDLHAELASRGASLRIVGAHGTSRDLLRAEGVEQKVGGLDRTATVESVLRAIGA